MTADELAKAVTLLETAERAAEVIVSAARAVLEAAHGPENLSVIEARWRSNLAEAQKNAGD